MSQIGEAFAMIEEVANSDAEIMSGVVADVTDFYPTEIIIIAMDNINS